MNTYPSLPSRPPSSRTTLQSSGCLCVCMPGFPPSSFVRSMFFLLTSGAGLVLAIIACVCKMVWVRSKSSALKCVSLYLGVVKQVRTRHEGRF